MSTRVRKRMQIFTLMTRRKFFVLFMCRLVQNLPSVCYGPPKPSSQFVLQPSSSSAFCPLPPYNKTAAFNDASPPLRPPPLVQNLPPGSGAEWIPSRRRELDFWYIKFLFLSISFVYASSFGGAFPWIVPVSNIFFRIICFLFVSRKIVIYCGRRVDKYSKMRHDFYCYCCFYYHWALLEDHLGITRLSRVID